MSWRDRIGQSSREFADAFLAAPAPDGTQLMYRAMNEPHENTNRIFLTRLLIEAQDIHERGDTLVKEHEVTHYVCSDIHRLRVALEDLANGKTIAPEHLQERLSDFRQAAGAMAHYYLSKVLLSESESDHTRQLLHTVHQKDMAKWQAECEAAGLSNEDRHSLSALLFGDLYSVAPPSSKEISGDALAAFLKGPSQEAAQHREAMHLLNNDASRNGKVLSALHHFTNDLQPVTTQIMALLTARQQL